MKPHPFKPGETLDEPNNTFAILAMVFTILSMPAALCCGCLGWPGALAGLAFGIVGVVQFHQGKSDTIGGVLSWLSVLICTAMTIGVLVLAFVFGEGPDTSALEDLGVEVPTTVKDVTVEEVPTKKQASEPAPANEGATGRR